MAKNTHFRLNFWLPVTLGEKLDYIAERNYTNKSSVLRRLIQQEYEKTLKDALNREMQ